LIKVHSQLIFQGAILMRTGFAILGLMLALSFALSVAPAAPDAKADSERIAQLIKQLGSEDFAEREKASSELEQIGLAALPALREAARSRDPETKSRAEALVERLVKKNQAEKLLAPKKVHIIYKDTPVNEAVLDIGRKCHCSVQLHDPDNKLKGRTVTLDTGEAPFWEAFDQFCEKAGLSEATWEDLVKDGRPATPKGGMALLPAVGPFGPSLDPKLAGPGVIMLINGRPTAPIPTCYTGAMRLRLIKLSSLGGTPENKDEHLFALETRMAPGSQIREIESVALSSVTDDQGQKLTPVFAPPAAVARTPFAPPPPGETAAIFPNTWHGIGGVEYCAARVKKGPKEAKALTQFAGIVVAKLLPPAESVITVDNITKAAGTTVKGKEEGFLKINQVKEADGKILVKYEVEAPRDVVPAGGAALPTASPFGATMTGGPGASYGIALLDEKDEALTLVEMKAQASPAPGARGGVEMIATFRPGAGQKPAKLIFSGSKLTTLEVPCHFKDVPMK
jgi:hypothetical protein